MRIFSDQDILIKILPLSVATLDRMRAVSWMKMFPISVECISHSDVSGCVQILFSLIHVEYPKHLVDAVTTT
jgi:hypothetical protein